MTLDFLSWLRLSIYMCIVSIAIILSFQLKTEPSLVERRMALPLGLIFWALSLVCLGAGLCNYLKTLVLRTPEDEQREIDSTE